MGLLPGLGAWGVLMAKDGLRAGHATFSPELVAKMTATGNLHRRRLNVARVPDGAAGVVHVHVDNEQAHDHKADRLMPCHMGYEQRGRRQQNHRAESGKWRRRFPRRSSCRPR